MTKVCSKCKAEKDSSDFYRCRSKKDGLNSRCKACTFEAQKKRREENPERVAEIKRRSYQKHRDKAAAWKRKYRAENKERIAEQARLYYEANKEKAAKTSARWQANNRDKCREKARRYYKAHRDKVAEYRRQYAKANPKKIAEGKRRYLEANRAKANKARRLRESIRKKSDLQYKVKLALRIRLSTAIRKNHKTGSAVRDLGCSVDFLKSHIEAQFTEGMSWDNWGKGKGKWQIDHIYPLAKTDLEDRTQLLAVCNWRNLQPLWHDDNVRKGDEVTDEAQALFDALCRRFQPEKEAVA